MTEVSRFLAIVSLLFSVNDSTLFAASATNRPHHQNSGHNQEATTTTTSQHECGIYFAPSTVPGAGFGIFAGRDYAENEYVTPGDLAIPIIELEWHNGFGQDYEDLWEEYQWAADTFPGMPHEAVNVEGASFGIGALPNCYHPLINLEVMTTTIDSAAGLHRSRDPGAGAFTPYHGRTSYAYKDIPQGMELFVDYGGDYFVGSEGRYGLIPTAKDYEHGDYLVSKYVALREGMLHAKASSFRKNVNLDETCEYGNHDESCEIEPPAPSPPLVTEVQSTFLNLLQNLADVWQSKPLKTVPDDPALVNYVSQYGTSHLHYNRSFRSLAWLEENGLCMDNIKPGSSTIKQAGRGGFASRSLVEGQVVAGMPLIHLPNRDMYKMYEELNDAPYRNETAHVHWQLMLNYCFGHRYSSLLLCPYGILTASINHSQERANTKIQWSRKATRHPEWFDQPIAEWGETLHSGLSFELVATRDIAPNEELLLDYGDEWEEAWQRHVANWKPPDGAEAYRSASDLNQIKELVIRTVAEGHYDPTDKILVCREKYDEGEYVHEKDDPYEIRYPCRAVERYKNEMGEYRYVAEVYEEEVLEDGRKVEFGLEIWHDLPREAFHFYDGPYTQDHIQREAFRHDMRIPDEMMPKVWMNRLESSSSSS